MEENIIETIAEEVISDVPAKATKGSKVAPVLFGVAVAAGVTLVVYRKVKKSKAEKENAETESTEI